MRSSSCRLATSSTATSRRLSSSGSMVSAQEAEALREQYGLNSPIWVQYWKWVTRVVRGDFGVSLEWNRPVTEVIGDRLWLTIVISIAAIILTWGIALPIGIYSAVRQYSIADYIFTFVGFVGLAVPNFLLALIIMYLGFRFFDASIGGLFSADYALAPWSWGKVWDLIIHLPLPALILALAGTAQLIRIMRANLLDELRRPYVTTARARGLQEWRVIVKYPVRAALNPFASTIGYLLPFVVSGSIVVSLVSVLADDRARAAARPGRAGHVPRRRHRPAARRHDRDRHLPLGSRADVDRSAHPGGDARMSTVVEAAPGPGDDCGRGEGCGRDPAAAHLVAFPQAQARGGERLRGGVLLSGGGVRRFPRGHQPARNRRRAQLHPAAADPLVRRRPLRPTCLRAHGQARHAHLQAGLRARSERQALPHPVRAGLRLQPVRPDPDRPAPDRPRSRRCERCAVPARHRPARAAISGRA